MALIDHLAAGHPGKLRIDLPANQTELQAYLLACDFAVVSQPPVMLLHSDQLPERNHPLYAIAAQAFG